MPRNRSTTQNQICGLIVEFFGSFGYVWHFFYLIVFVHFEFCFVRFVSLQEWERKKVWWVERGRRGSGRKRKTWSKYIVRKKVAKEMYSLIGRIIEMHKKNYLIDFHLTLNYTNFLSLLGMHACIHITHYTHVLNTYTYTHVCLLMSFLELYMDWKIITVWIYTISINILHTI